MLTGFARWDAAVAASTRAVKRMHIIIKTSILWLLVDLVQNSTGLNWTGNIVPGQGEWDSIAEKFYNSLEPPVFRCFLGLFSSLSVILLSHENRNLSFNLRCFPAETEKNFLSRRNGVSAYFFIFSLYHAFLTLSTNFQYIYTVKK